MNTNDQPCLTRNITLATSEKMCVISPHPDEHISFPPKNIFPGPGLVWSVNGQITASGASTTAIYIYSGRVSLESSSPSDPRG